MQLTDNFYKFYMKSIFKKILRSIIGNITFIVIFLFLIFLLGYNGAGERNCLFGCSYSLWEQIQTYAFVFLTWPALLFKVNGINSPILISIIGLFYVYGLSFLGNKYTKKYLLKDKITSKNIKYVQIIIIVVLLSIYGYFLYGAMYESSYPCNHGPNSITAEIKVLSPKEIELNDLKQNNPIITENMVIKQGETDDKIIIIADKKISDMILLFHGEPRCMGSSMGSFMGYDNLENIRTTVRQKNGSVVQKGRRILEYKVDPQNGDDQTYQLRTMWGWGMYKDERELEIIWVDL